MAAGTGRQDALEVSLKKPWPLAPVPRSQSQPRRLRLQQWGPQGALVTAALLTAAALWFLSATMPAPLILPVVSTLLLLGSAILALVAWRHPGTDPRLPNYWDASGALTMAGIGAALLSEPDAVLPLIEAHWPTEKTSN
jgi:hypothetical protein